MPKCLNSSCWALAMIARASAFFSTLIRCSYQSIASASSISERIIRANVRTSCDNSSAGSWYWSNPIAKRPFRRQPAFGHVGPMPRAMHRGMVARFERPVLPVLR